MPVDLGGIRWQEAHELFHFLQSAEKGILATVVAQPQDETTQIARSTLCADEFLHVHQFAQCRVRAVHAAAAAAAVLILRFGIVRVLAANGFSLALVAVFPTHFERVCHTQTIECILMDKSHRWCLFLRAGGLPKIFPLCKRLEPVTGRLLRDMFDNQVGCLM